jgi:hypothetical protein
VGCGRWNHADKQNGLLYLSCGAMTKMTGSETLRWPRRTSSLAMGPPPAIPVIGAGFGRRMSSIWSGYVGRARRGSRLTNSAQTIGNGYCMQYKDKKPSISRPRKARTYSLAAERMRRHRQRRREGLTHVPIDLRRSEIDGLVRLGLLSAETRNDVTAIRKSLYQYFERTLDSNS